MVAYTSTQSQVVAFGGRVPATRYARRYGKLSGHLRAMRVTAKGFCGLSSRMWSCAKGLSFQPPSLQPLLLSSAAAPETDNAAMKWCSLTSSSLLYYAQPLFTAVPWIHEAKNRAGQV